MTAFKKYVDKVEVMVQAGAGGAGSVHFRHEIYVPKGGPDGGDGGAGGDVIFLPTHNMQTLLDLKVHKHYQAGNGEPGKGKNQSGKQGKPKIIQVPLGTMIMDTDGHLIADLTEEKPVTIAKGGKGGLGNQHFATSRNQTPRYAQKGLPGEELMVVLEMRLIAEVGLVGLPNSGKSTLLKQLTKANPKIANYPFTTLYPNLGVLKYEDRELVLADIPGLIEGASTGAGLGHDFLRHISRTKVLIHLVEIIQDQPELCFENYQIICRELRNTPYQLDQKKQIVVLNKVDLIEEKTHKIFTKFFVKHGIKPILISGYTGYGMVALKQGIIRSTCDVQRSTFEVG